MQGLTNATELHPQPDMPKLVTLTLLRRASPVFVESPSLGGTCFSCGYAEVLV
jgi:hypothetical protein